jgi:hypothetical protein
MKIWRPLSASPVVISGTGVSVGGGEVFVGCGVFVGGAGVFVGATSGSELPHPASNNNPMLITTIK